MPKYCLYFFGPEDDYQRAEVLICSDDEAAIFEAQRTIGANDVEIWKEGKMIARLRPSARKRKDLVSSGQLEDC
jgi:hypothetical protein